jgi:hypothetical protein
MGDYHVSVCCAEKLRKSLCSNQGENNKNWQTITASLEAQYHVRTAFIPIIRPAEHLQRATYAE